MNIKKNDKTVRVTESQENLLQISKRSKAICHRCQNGTESKKPNLKISTPLAAVQNTMPECDDICFEWQRLMAVLPTRVHNGNQSEVRVPE